MVKGYCKMGSVDGYSPSAFIGIHDVDEKLDPASPSD